VDRFISLIYHVVNYTAHLRSTRLNPEDVEDIAAEVLLKIVASDFRLLREFRGDASLATYLTVITRRICIQELLRKQKSRDASSRWDDRAMLGEPDSAPAALKGMESLEEVEVLLKSLSGKEREIVRLYYLEGRTYEEISTETEIPVNTIGAVLSRARKKLRDTTGADGKAAQGKSGMVPKSGTVRKVPTGGDGGSSKAGMPGLPAGNSKAVPAVPKSGTVRKVPDSGTVRPVKPSRPAKPTKEEDAEDE
jgi:RNA polymerase sigma-70 factor (ECF subfamily)